MSVSTVSQCSDILLFKPTSVCVCVGGAGGGGGGVESSIQKPSCLRLFKKKKSFLVSVCRLQ